MNLSIEAGIPLPPRKKGVKGKIQWTSKFAAMRPGESFVIPDGLYGDPAIPRRAAHLTAERMGIKAACRSVPEGIRIWRLT